jgi:quinol monooxygenase YgiN
MITFIVHMQVRPESAQAFEELMTYVSKTTLENEHGVAHYGFAKSVDDDDTYVVVEVYRDQAAVAAHGDTAWVRDSVPKMLQLVEGMPQLKQYTSPGAESVVSRFEDMT